MTTIDYRAFPVDALNEVIAWFVPWTYEMDGNWQLALPGVDVPLRWPAIGEMRNCWTAARDRVREVIGRLN
jgi:hypothetical protein